MMYDKNSKISDSIRKTETGEGLRTCCSSIVDIKTGWEPAALQSLLTTGRYDALWARVSSLRMTL